MRINRSVKKRDRGQADKMKQMRTYNKSPKIQAFIYKTKIVCLQGLGGKI